MQKVKQQLSKYFLRPRHHARPSFPTAWSAHQLRHSQTSRPRVNILNSFQIFYFQISKFSTKFSSVKSCNSSSPVVMSCGGASSGCGSGVIFPHYFSHTFNFLRHHFLVRFLNRPYRFHSLQCQGLCCDPCYQKLCCNRRRTVCYKPFIPSYERVSHDLQLHHTLSCVLLPLLKVICVFQCNEEVKMGKLLGYDYQRRWFCERNVWLCQVYGQCGGGKLQLRSQTFGK